jgi:GDP-4-dehydro-6-deoxy-D-mannose reductase
VHEGANNLGVANLPDASGIVRVAVTGSSGFVGSWFTRRAREFGPRPIEVLPLRPRGADAEGPGLDILEADAVMQAVGDVAPDVVLHLAAVAAPAEARADPKHAWGVNVMGTLNVARAVLAQAPGARFIFVSSSEVYGGSFLGASTPLHEAAALEPRNVYGATKAAADIMIGQMAHDGLNAIRFRPFNHTGPGQSDSFVVAAFARQIARIEKGLQPPVLAVGNLSAERDFLDVRDVVDAYILAASGLEPVAPSAVFNLATASPVRIADILDMLLAEARLPIKVEVDEARLRSNDIPRASGDASRAALSLGWKPRIPLATTVRDCLEFWRTHDVGIAGA